RHLPRLPRYRRVVHHLSLKCSLASPRRSVCAPGTVAFPCTADPPTKESLMFPSLWFRRAAGKQPAPRWHRPYTRLCLEPLEDRCLPAAATFSGLPYIVSPVVQVTHTAPEVEEVIAVNPNDPKTLVATIIDASQAVGQSSPFTGVVEKYAFSFDNGAAWTEKFNTLVTADGQAWDTEIDP